MAGGRRLASAVLLVSALLAHPLVAQEPEAELQSDRPDLTTGAITMPARRLQLEGGFLYTRDEGVTENDIGQLTVRYGLVDDFELRLDSGSWVELRGGASGWSGGGIGFKWRWLEGQGGRPTIGLVASAAAPWGSGGMGPGAWQPQALLAASWSGEGWGVDANVGGARLIADDGRFDQAFWSLSISRSLTDTWSLFGEYYGDSREEPGGEASHFVNGGVGWLVRADLLLDAWGGDRIAGAGADWYAGTGLTYRF